MAKKIVTIIALVIVLVSIGWGIERLMSPKVAADETVSGLITKISVC